MDANSDYDWKQKVGIPINYETGESSDDEFDTKDVVFRNPHSSSGYLLADRGDGSEADLLGTTPPRSRIRDKEKRRSFMDTGSAIQRTVREKKDVVDHAIGPEPIPIVPERFRKRASQKLLRSKERDWKLDMTLQNKADSLPSPNPLPAVPTLVESCSRFMSLTSRPKCREACEFEDSEPEERWREQQNEHLPASRVNFHKTFSMLINMGNVEKGCKRTISREEQVWQNELKDLIWLELQAKIAGRTLAQQDCYLCSQRKIVPKVISNILEYKFVNNNPCSNSIDYVDNGSQEKTDADSDDIDFGCLRFDCQTCSNVVGQAMREVYSLLEAYDSAVSLYPSTKAMTVDHPSIATALFKNRLKAMCLWYNTALNMRLKMLAVRGFYRSMKMRSQRDRRHRGSYDSEIVKQKCDASNRISQVRFDVNISGNPTPTDSSNSDCSHKEEEDSKQEIERVGERGDDNCGSDNKTTNLPTPEIVIDSEYSSSSSPTTSADTPNTSADTPTTPADPPTASPDTPTTSPDTPHSSADTPTTSADKEIPTADTPTTTADTAESGYTSGVEQDMAQGTRAERYDDVYDVGSFEEVTKFRLLDKSAPPMFREFYHESLKTQGVRRAMSFINKLRKEILYKVYFTIAKHIVIPENEENDLADEVDQKDEGNADENQNEWKNYELKRFGCWSKECKAMRLPSYRSHFLFLNALSLEAMHDYLELRLAAAPETPSCLTVKQLIHDLKEGLDMATEMRVEFVRSADAALSGRKHVASHLLRVIRTYDETIETVLKLYLSYLTTVSGKEPLRRGYIQSEWMFTGRLARRVRCAHALAPTAFSKIACNQLNRLVKQFEEEFEHMADDDDCESPNTCEDKIERQKVDVLRVCRRAQRIFAGGRARAVGAAGWARALAARLSPVKDAALRDDIFNSLMAICDYISQQVQFVLKKSDPSLVEGEVRDIVVTRIRELLLQICKLGFELHRELYQLVGHVPPRERVSRPASLPPRRAARAARPRPGTMHVHDASNPVLTHLAIHKELHQLVHEGSPRAASPPRAPTLTPSRNRPFTIMRTDSVLDEVDATEDRMMEHINHFGDAQTHTTFELLLTDGQTDEVVELRRPPPHIRIGQEQEWAAKVARAVIEFAKCWMRFVLERCDRGRGLRPRWASQGLEFLMLACDPCNTKHLSDEEFEELKQLMDGCISHVIGSRPSADMTPSPRPRHRLHSPLPSTTSSRENLTPPTPCSELDPLQNYEGNDTNRLHRVLTAVDQVDRCREAQLLSAGRVGRVLKDPRHAPATAHRLRKVTFQWQRGLKIGAGTFGKVYTIVNTESGQLLAMKELSIGAADRRAFQRAANELQVLEGVIHPHLVRYYGCEMHREEMLIFMELCVEGSLEALVATSGALQELTVRRYTKQLLSAVHALHARSIAHRDIKSGNIFLTNDGHCLKLGDFGCAVKIRANTTAPNELQGFVGTQAYMAPEVFMKSSGHGRAADIWSVGCVVTEMASGKRPFSEYDSNYQIMFVVGMGGRPAAPGGLSPEGGRFLALCLTHDPQARPTAHHLMSHTFLLVKSDDDCKCEPAYLIK